MINNITYCHKCGGNCWNCFYAEDCNVWNDVAPYNPLEMPVTEIAVALCESRHEIPQAKNGSIFPEPIENPMDFDGMYEAVSNQLDSLVKNGLKLVRVYVTGLTPALLTLVNYCHDNKVRIITYHYNRETGGYNSLPVR